MSCVQVLVKGLATSSGGAVWCRSADTVLIRGGTFTTNNAQSGGGVYLSYLPNEKGNVTLIGPMAFDDNGYLFKVR